MKNVFWIKYTDICPQEFNWQSFTIGTDNGLMPNRQQAIIWTNADPIHWRIYATLEGDELTQMFIANVWKPFSTVWSPMSNIHYLSRNLWTLKYLKSNKLHFLFFSDSKKQKHH